MSLLSINAAQPAEALLVFSQTGVSHSALLDNIQRITFSAAGDLLLKSVGGGETAIMLDNIAKIAFDDMVIMDVPVVETDNYPSLRANIVGYYSILGVRLNKEPASGFYIIVYDNGKAEKVLK